MKTYLNLRLPIIAIGLSCCFLFLNFECTDIVKSPTPTTPNTGNQGKAKVVYIELLNYWAAKQTYTDCARNNQDCEKEKATMYSMEKLAKGIVFPPMPNPPSPCTPWGNCNGFKFLEHLVYPADQKYKIVIFDNKTNKAVARNDPGSAFKSKLVRGYVNTKYKVLAPNYSGFAKVEITNLVTNQSHSYNVKM